MLVLDQCTQQHSEQDQPTQSDGPLHHCRKQLYSVCIPAKVMDTQDVAAKNKEQANSEMACKNGAKKREVAQIFPSTLRLRTGLAPKNRVRTKGSKVVNDRHDQCRRTSHGVQIMLSRLSHVDEVRRASDGKKLIVAEFVRILFLTGILTNSATDKGRSFLPLARKQHVETETRDQDDRGNNLKHSGF